MTQEHQFFGLNMLPIFLEMIEAKLEIAGKQLSSLTDVKKLVGIHKDVILKTAQNYLLEVDRFFEQFHKWGSKRKPSKFLFCKQNQPFCVIS